MYLGEVPTWRRGNDGRKSEKILILTFRETSTRLQSTLYVQTTRISPLAFCYTFIFNFFFFRSKITAINLYSIQLIQYYTKFVYYFLLDFFYPREPAGGHTEIYRFQFVVPAGVHISSLLRRPHDRWLPKIIYYYINSNKYLLHIIWRYSKQTINSIDGLEIIIVIIILQTYKTEFWDFEIFFFKFENKYAGMYRMMFYEYINDV